MNKPLAVATADDTLWSRLGALADEWNLTRLRTAAALFGDALPPLILLDADLPSLPPWHEPRLRGLLRGHNVLGVAGDPDATLGPDAFAAGLGGRCHAYAALTTLRQALRTLAAGQLWIGRDMMSHLLHTLPARAEPAGDWHQPLTAREREVAELAARGAQNTQIAARLGITERTVKAHLSATFEKLGVADRLQLALRVHGID